MNHPLPAPAASPVKDAGPGLRMFLALTQFLLLLDTSILNVAIPELGRDLGLSAVAETWVLNAYLVAFGGMLLVSGYVADVLGHGRVLVAGLSVLAAGAVIGALANDGAVVIASRAIQGIGAAAAAAAAMSLVFSRFDGTARTATLGLFAAMAGLGGAAGTALSGVLTEVLGWRSTFWLNVGGAVLLAIWTIRLPEFFGRGTPRTFNFAGGILLTVALGSVAYAISSSTNIADLGGQFTISAVLAVLALAAFVVLERRRQAPLINPVVWRTRPLVRALVLAGTGQWVLVPIFLFISFYLQRVLGSSAFEAGMALLPMSLLIVVIAPLLPRIVAHWGIYRVMAFAFALIAAASAWLVAISPTGGFASDVLGPTLLLAVGLPAVSVTTSVLAAEHGPPEDPGIVSGLLTSFQQFGAILGLAVWSAIAACSAPVAAIELTTSYARAFLVAAIVMAFAAAAAIFAHFRAGRPGRASAEQQAS